MGRKEQCDNIDRMSKILLERQEILDKLESVLDELDEKNDEFQAIKEYFSSEQRMKDIDADEKGEIPESINRAALTQDELYNMLEDNHDVAVHMIESAAGILKL